MALHDLFSLEWDTLIVQIFLPIEQPDFSPDKILHSFMLSEKN